MGREHVRRWIAGILMLGTLLSLTACAFSKSDDRAKPDKEPSSERDIEETGDPAAVFGSSDSGNSKILIAYFTWAENAAKDSGVDAVSSASVLPPGNVAQMAMFSFLEENNLADKKVVLFCSHGTGGLASSVKDISAVLPDSTVESNALGIYREDIPESQEKIKDWLNEIGY